MKPFYKRWWFIVLAILTALGGIGALAPSQNPDAGPVATTTTNSTSSSTSTSTTKPPLSWRELLNPEVNGDNLISDTCKLLRTSLDSQLREVRDRLDQIEEPSLDAYAAVEFVPKNAWIEVDQLQAIQESLNEMALDTLGGQVKFIDLERATQFINEATETCDLTTTLSELKALAKSLNAKSLIVQTRLKNVPWYPKGFKSLDSNTAFRFLKYGTEYKCSYYGAYCYGVEIVTKTGCGTLYAELTIFDSSGRNIGWTNDTATNIRPNERVVLIFDTFESGADTGRLNDVSCY